MSVRIFLSAVSDEFRDYRDQLRRDLTRHNVEVKVQEDFKDLGGVTLDKLDVYIAACDAVVHLVGDMTGAAAKPESTKAIFGKYADLMDKLPPLRQPLENRLDISYTQWEAWLALYHDKLLLIGKADDTAPRGPQYRPTDASRAAQRMHLERLRACEHYPGCSFTSPDNLAKQILSSVILDLLARELLGAATIEQIETAVRAKSPGYSCFISFSFADEAFGNRLYERLRQEGVQVWFAPHDMKGGQKIRAQVTAAIGTYDKLLLVLSESSIRSNWVDDELYTAFHREKNERRKVLFPIRLVPYDALRQWQAFDADTGRDLAREIREYFIPDFSNWKDDAAFDAAMDQLLASLRKSDETPKDDRP